MSYAISRPRGASNLLESNRLRIQRPPPPFPSPPLPPLPPDGTLKPGFQLFPILPPKLATRFYRFAIARFKLFDVINVFLRLDFSLERVSHLDIRAFVTVASEKNCQCYHALSSKRETKVERKRYVPLISHF